MRKQIFFAIFLLASAAFFILTSRSFSTNALGVELAKADPAVSLFDQLPLGQWYEIPDSRLSAVDPCPSRDCAYSGIVGQAAVVTAWSGGAYDTSRDRLLLWGGGHADYGGNEIYAFDIGTLKWLRVWGPTNNVASVLSPGTETYSDGNPVSRHTYSALAYIESTDQLFSQGGALYRSGNGTKATWLFDVKTNSWHRKDDNSSGVGGIWGQSAYDPVTKHVFHQDNNGLMEFDPVGNIWTIKGKVDGGIWNASLTAAIDPSRRLFVAVGGRAIYVWDLNSFQLTRPATTGGDAIISANAPGFVYNPTTKKFLAWSGGHVLYELDPTTWKWTAINPEKESKSPGTAVSQGTYGRFQYIPSKDAVIVVNGNSENVYVYKFPHSTNNARHTSLDLTSGLSTHTENTSAALASTLPLRADENKADIASDIGVARENGMLAVSLPPSKPIVTTFKLASPAAPAVAPFAIGHAFRRGDIPKGNGIASNLRNFQATIKNRWSDGSVKFAILAGSADLTSGEERIKLYPGPLPVAKNLNENDLLTTHVSAAIKFSPYGRVQLESLIGRRSVYNAATHRWSPGLVRQWIAGPEMASWIYYSPIGADPHLAAWFEVRAWRNGAVEVLPWIENGYLNIAKPEDKSGEASVEIDGQSRFSETLHLPHHTRTPLVKGATFSYWRHTDPRVIVRHDVAYLQSTKLTPAYYGRIANESPLFSRIAQTYQPMQAANVPTEGMGAGGYNPWIGILPEHDVAYLTSAADPRAWAAVVVNGYAAGSFGTHYRDETTNQPLRFSAYPYLVINEKNSGVMGAGASSKSQYTPPPTGKIPGRWDVSHHPSLGYMAYLLTGRFYFMEEAQFTATANFLLSTDVPRQFSKYVILSNHYTTRGAAWTLRSLAQAAAITPDNEALKAEFSQAIENNIHYYHSKYIAQSNNPQGFCQPYSNYVDNSISGTGSKAMPWKSATWMEDFLTASWGYLADISSDTLAAPMQTKLAAFMNWKYKSIVGRLGGKGSAEYFFLDAASYIIAYAPGATSSTNWENGAGPWYADWGQIYQATMGHSNPMSPDDNHLRGSYFPNATSYWGNLQPAIAYAVDAEASGALEAYKRMTGAANWSQILTGPTGFGEYPVWGVKPHNDVRLTTSSIVPK